MTLTNILLTLMWWANCALWYKVGLNRGRKGL